MMSGNSSAINLISLFDELAVIRADRPVHRSIEDSYWIEEDQLSRGKPDTLQTSGPMPQRVEYRQKHKFYGRDIVTCSHDKEVS